MGVLVGMFFPCSGQVTAKGQTSASHVHDVQVLDSEAPAAEVSNAALPPEAHILTAEELDAEMNGSGSSADVTTHSCGVVALITPHPVEVSGENESLASATSEASVPVADMLEVEEPAAEVFEFGPEEFAADLPDGELPVTILLQDELLAAHTVESECPTAEMATAEAPGPAEVPEYLMAETPERALESEISVLEAPSVEVSDAESPELEVAGTSGDASTSKKAAASCIMLKGCVDTDDGIVPEEEMAAWAAQIHRFGREYDVGAFKFILIIYKSKAEQGYFFRWCSCYGVYSPRTEHLAAVLQNAAVFPVSNRTWLVFQERMCCGFWCFMQNFFAWCLNHGFQRSRM